MRTWPGLAAVGAGLIHLGVAADSAPPLLALLVLVGASEVGWGVVALARDAVPRPRAALTVSAVLVAAWTAVLLVGAAAHHSGGGPLLPVGATAGAALLDLAVAAILAVGVRRASPGVAHAGVLGFLLPTAVGAGLVAVVVSTCLASTGIGAGGHGH